ncbi:200_t:CDS:1, partial [Racocetra persica]
VFNEKSSWLSHKESLLSSDKQPLLLDELLSPDELSLDYEPSTD